MNKLEILVALNITSGIGYKTMCRLEEHFGSLEDALNASEQSLKEVHGVGPALAEKVREARSAPVAHEFEQAEKLGVRIIGPDDAMFPARLKEIEDRPIVLYVKGTLKSEDNLALAMVGSRMCSHYGRKCAATFAEQLARRGLTIVSGLARGIDSEAHRGALRAGRTIAVLGCGLEHIYPPENKELAEQVAKNGAVISEFPIGMGVDRTHFPRRNRLISGLSLGVFVVEGSRDSGSLITADWALRQGREVFALPGQVDNKMAGGSLKLIKQGAKLVETVDDILEDLGPLPDAPSIAVKEILTTAAEERLSDDERKIFSVLEHNPLDIESIIDKTDMSPNTATYILTMLQIKGLATQLPGMRFQKK